MSKLLLFPIILLISLLFFEKEQDVNQYLEEAIEWIETNSDFKYEGQPLPIIVFSSSNDLQRVYYTEEQLADKRIHKPTVLAAYNMETNTMYFNLEGEFGWKDFPTLLHEMVHYMQKINGREGDCVGFLEEQAYELEEKWVVDRRHFDPPMDPFTIFTMKMACNGPHY